MTALRVFVVAIFLLAAVLLANAAKESDRINSLPGLSFLPTYKMYSGYMTVNQTNGRNLFYWFVQSADDPVNDPLVLWLNGGPGCSSLIGFFTENGPFHVQENSTLVPNPWSWNKVANMIYLESPAGVGYSYSKTPSDYTTGDNQTMQDNYQFLLEFFRNFPEYSTNDFYISGESYGGHYVPQLAWTILNGNSAKKNLAINLKGFIVGNAWTDDVIDSNSVPPFYYFHALSSLSTWKQVEKECGITGDDARRANITITRKGLFREDLLPELISTNLPCNIALSAQRAEVGTHINQYDIYTPCFNHDVNGLACMNYTALIDYLNTKSVQNALHATPQFPWAVCSNNINYNEQWPSVLPIYGQLMDNLRITVYAGDVTFNVPFNGAEVWIQGFNRPVVSAWQPWTVDDQTAGYIIKYDKIHFVTVRDAGHMVPMYQPQSAFYFFERYLSGIM